LQFSSGSSKGVFVVKIRLKRIGSKGAPYYRIVAVDKRNRRDGMPIEELGHYNPRTKDLKVNREAVEKWIKNGAQASNTVAALLKRAEPVPTTQAS
jgi:small subunit ribosomal protein S16